MQLVYVAEGAEEEIDSTLRFLLSPRSAYVSGQVVEVGKAVDKDAGGRLGAAARRQDGAGHRRLARHRRGDRRPPCTATAPSSSCSTCRRSRADLARSPSGSTPRRSSSTSPTPDAPLRIAEAISDGVDIVVHNAGVTRDRTIAKMPEDRWTSLMEINLSSEERIDDELLGRKLLRDNGRIVCVSSMSGIAGNSGQTNYATSKAGVIGMVEALAPELAERGATINAVAPGFIETQMTAAMPIAIREAGRRMNSMSQGGLPVDVAETIAWFASPASTGVNGNVVRVCGQSLLGA